MGFFTASRRRRFFAIAATPLVIATAAFGYWLATQIIGEGSGSNKVAKGTPTTETIPVSVSFPELKGPGQPVPIEITINEGLIKKEPMVIDRAVVSFTNSKESEGCSDSWFTLSHFQEGTVGGSHYKESELFGAGLATPIIIKPNGEGEARLSGAGAEVELKNEPEVLQSACEGAELHVHVKTEP
jgi:hypothetical protein